MKCKNCENEMIYSFREEYPNTGMFRKYYYCPTCGGAEIIESQRRLADQTETKKAELAAGDMII